MRAKAGTLIEKLGFVDPDRKTSKHDEIQLWAYDNANEIIGSFMSNKYKAVSNYKTLELPVVYRERYYKMFVGYIDLSISGNILDENGERLKCFYASLEIKTKIDSCGDLIRQINFYRGYQECETTWIVVSPDDRFTEILRQHRIFFFKYKDPSILF